MPHNPRSLI